jgi:hypothetical protein
MQRIARLLDQMPVVEVLHGLLQSNGNKQADDDNRDVNDGVLPSVNAFVRLWISIIGRSSFSSIRSARLVSNIQQCRFNSRL